MYVGPYGTIWDHMGPYGTKVVPKMFEYARDLHGLLNNQGLLNYFFFKKNKKINLGKTENRVFFLTVNWLAKN